MTNVTSKKEILVKKSYVKDKDKNIYKYIKRIFDIFFGIIGLIILIPLTICIYIARKILKEDNGPMFYEQLRIGKNGKTFKIYKYRTMVVGADDILNKYLKENPKAKKEYETYKKLKKDPRVTKIGEFLRKTSIDEMPQFFNVLLGNMTLVGPRPYLLREKDDMGKSYDYIIQCKPGITGLWQVSGRNDTTFKKRLEIDVEYVSNYGFIMDLKIIYKTIKRVLKQEGAV